VDEVDDHVGEFALDRLFAGVVEVEALQVVADAIGHDVAAGGHMHLDGVAGVFKRD
jgi:hypothetical protein